VLPVSARVNGCASNVMISELTPSRLSSPSRPSVNEVLRFSQARCLFPHVWTAQTGPSSKERPGDKQEPLGSWLQAETPMGFWTRAT
jgi:hypothetical protein